LGWIEPDVGSNSSIWAESTAPIPEEIEGMEGPVWANSFVDKSVFPMINGEGKDLGEFDGIVGGGGPMAAAGGSISMEVEVMDVVLKVEVDGVPVG
jgi:hypothetical protein